MTLARFFFFFFWTRRLQEFGFSFFVVMWVVWYIVEVCFQFYMDAVVSFKFIPFILILLTETYFLLIIIIFFCLCSLHNFCVPLYQFGRYFFLSLNSTYLFFHISIAFPSLSMKRTWKSWQRKVIKISPTHELIRNVLINIHSLELIWLLCIHSVGFSGLFKYNPL